MPKISIIVATAEQNVIGINGSLPWYLPADLARFKQLTIHKPIVMGRKTFESLPGILPGRKHIILTRNPTYDVDGCTCVLDAQSAIQAAGDVDEIMIIGGAQIYSLFLPVTDCIYLTEVKAKFLGQSKFPTLNPNEWRIENKTEYQKDAKNEFDMLFYELTRKAKPEFHFEQEE